MRRTIRIFASTSAAVVLVTLAFASALADGYDGGCTPRCSDCHLLHTSPDAGSVSGDTAVDRGLLTGGTVAKTCLQCHNNRPGVPDVAGPDVNNPDEQCDGTERAAGSFSESAATDHQGHNLPGRDARSIAGCTVCHDAHGNDNHRNLRPLDGSKEGPVAFVNPKATGLAQFQRMNVGYARNIGDKMCLPCHECGPANMIHSDEFGRWKRHPNSGADMVVTISRKRNDIEHWVRGMGCGFTTDGQPLPRLPFAARSATNYYAATTVAADNEVFCLSCHKAHGSMNAYGMQWPCGDGNSLSRDSGCNQCHNVLGE